MRSIRSSVQPVAWPDQSGDLLVRLRVDVVDEGLQLVDLRRAVAAVARRARSLELRQERLLLLGVDRALADGALHRADQAFDRRVHLERERDAAGVAEEVDDVDPDRVGAGGEGVAVDLAAVLDRDAVTVEMTEPTRPRRSPCTRT